MKLTAHTTSITANTGFEPYLQVLEANKAPYYAWKFVPINQVEGVNPRSQLYQSLKNQNVLEIWSEGEASEDGYVWLLSDGKSGILHARGLQPGRRWYNHSPRIGSEAKEIRSRHPGRIRRR
jgi:hypothetical protein